MKYTSDNDQRNVKCISVAVFSLACQTLSMTSCRILISSPGSSASPHVGFLFTSIQLDLWWQHTSASSYAINIVVALQLNMHMSKIKLTFHWSEKLWSQILLLFISSEKWTNGSQQCSCTEKYLIYWSTERRTDIFSTSWQSKEQQKISRTASFHFSTSRESPQLHPLPLQSQAIRERSWSAFKTSPLIFRKQDLNTDLTTEWIVELVDKIGPQK